MAKRLPMLDPFEEIRRLYFSTTRETIERDLQRAMELLRQMPGDQERERAAGLMHGLTDLRREWKRASRKRRPPRTETAPPPAGSGSREGGKKGR